MNWKIKATIQNAVSLLPERASFATYYWIQKRFGHLEKIAAKNKFFVGIETWRRIKSLGYVPVGKVFFEVGTGRAPLVPLAYYLMGAVQTITVDLNPYIKGEILAGALQHIVENVDQIRAQFGALLVEERLARLVDYYHTGQFAIADFLAVCGISYLAPADAARTGLEDSSVDFHTSNTTLEHIPGPVMVNILREGNRIVKTGGLFIHRVDYSDHFSHSDRKLSAINFLQYSDKQWNRYAGNRYMYMNRLRHDDVLEIFERAGHTMVMVEPDIDRGVVGSVSSGQFRLADRFAGKSIEAIAVTGAWIISCHV